MVKLETFIELCNIFQETSEKSSSVERELETVLGKGFRGSYGGDNSIMLIWPVEAVGSMLQEILKDMGESKEGAKWFVYEGLDQITSGMGTTIDDVEIQSIEDYYNYLKKTVSE